MRLAAGVGVVLVVATMSAMLINAEAIEHDDAVAISIGARRIDAANSSSVIELLPGLNELDTRDSLNALVAASVEDNQQLSNVAFVKTHKTGSQTVAALFERYGKRHRLKVAHYAEMNPPLRFADTADEIVQTAGGGVDIMHYHMGPWSFKLGTTWAEAETTYRRIMRDPDNINFVALFRDPREHLISYYYYFMEHQTEKNIVEFLHVDNANHPHVSRLRNTLSGEMGLTSLEQVEDFVANVLPRFKMVLLTEKLNPGLMVLRRLMGWHFIDMTYIILNETKTPASTWTSKNGVEMHRPHYKHLPTHIQTKIDELTAIDAVLYEGGKAAFEKTLEPVADLVEKDLVIFHQLQAAVYRYVLATRPNMYTLSGLYHTPLPDGGVPF